MRLVGNQLPTLQPSIDRADIITVDRTWFINNPHIEHPFDVIAETHDDKSRRFGRFDPNAVLRLGNLAISPDRRTQFARHAFLSHAVGSSLLSRTAKESQEIQTLAAKYVDQAINIEGERLMVGYAGRDGELHHLTRLVGFHASPREHIAEEEFTPHGLYLPAADWPYLEK